MPIEQPNHRTTASLTAPPPFAPEEASRPATAADIVYLADLPLQPVDWLWQGRLAAGTLAMLSGEPGAGKTFLALAIAAKLSSGRVLCNGENAKPCTVLYASTEHAGAEIVQPRFAALHGDFTRLVVLRSSGNNPIDPALLNDALERTHARLLILDPLQTYLGYDVDLDHLGKARPLLDRLARLAAHHHCCILLIRHLRKRGVGRPAQRGIGALSAAFRTEFLAGTSPDAPFHPALVQVRSNLGPLAPPLAYKIDRTGNFLWTGPSKLTAEEILAERPTGAGLPKRKFAGEWLRQYLKAGSQTQYRIELDAHREGVCIATLKRAKFDLGVISVKDGKEGHWYWSLPVTEDEHAN